MASADVPVPSRVSWTRVFSQRAYVADALLLVSYLLVRLTIIAKEPSRAVDSWFASVSDVETQSVFLLSIVCMNKLRRNCHVLEAGVSEVLRTAKIIAVLSSLTFDFLWTFLYLGAFLAVFIYLPVVPYDGPSHVLNVDALRFHHLLYNGKPDHYFLVNFYHARSDASVNFAPVFANMSIKYHTMYPNLHFLALDVQRCPGLMVRFDLPFVPTDARLPAVLLFHRGEPCEGARLTSSSSAPLTEHRVVNAFRLDEIGQPASSESSQSSALTTTTNGRTTSSSSQQKSKSKMSKSESQTSESTSESTAAAVETRESESDPTPSEPIPSSTDSTDTSTSSDPSTGTSTSTSTRRRTRRAD